jgi:large repetitive protein
LITTGGTSSAFTLAIAGTKTDVNFGFGNVQPPVAVNDVATTAANAPIVINVIGNDSSPGGVLDPATVTVIGSPTHGTTSIDPVTGAITYTPAPGFTGTDTLTYRVCEVGGTGGCVTAQVTITVANLPPVVPGGGPTTPINLTTTVGDVPPRLNITDPDGHPASITQLVSGSYPPGLTLNTDGTWSGSATVAGTYSFTVQVCDTGTPQACFDQQITVVVSPVVPPVVPPTTRRLPNSGANTMPMLEVAGGLMIVGLVLRRRSRRAAA